MAAGDKSRELAEGLIVEHSVWGRGKVADRSGPYLTIYFPSLEGSSTGPERKLRQDAPQLQIADDQAWDHQSKVRRPRAAPRRRQAPVGTLEQAVRWFQIEYPKAFRDSRFIAKEIDYKRRGHELWLEHFGRGRGTRLLRAGKLETVATALNDVAHSTNIPSRFELMALNDGLKHPPAAGELLRAILTFTTDSDAPSFEGLVQTVGSLPARAGGARVLTWPAVTIFPFLADPTRFMVLKPQAAKKIAMRLDWELLYDARPTWHCFDAWIKLGHELLDRLQPLGARDYIDVQSFLWETRDLD